MNTAEPTDDAVMTANAEGMNARDEGKSRYDNPYRGDTRATAWDDGWLHADDQKKGAE